MVEVQMASRSMFGKLSSEEREALVQSNSSSPLSEDSGIGWSPNPHDASDVRMEAEKPALRHQQVLEKGDKATEVAGMPYNQNRIVTLGSHVPEDFAILYGNLNAVPQQNFPQYYKETSVFSSTPQSLVTEEVQKISLTSIKKESSSEHRFMRLTGDFQRKTEVKKSKINMNLRKGPGGHRPHKRGKPGPPTVRERLDDIRKKNREKEQYYDSMGRGYPGNISCQFPSFLPPTMQHGVVSIPSGCSTFGPLNSAPGLQQEVCDDFSVQYCNSGASSSRLQSFSEFSPTPSGPISSSWSDASMSNNDFRLQTFGSSENRSVFPLQSSHFSGETSQDPSIYGLTQTTQFFPEDPLVMGSEPAEASYSICEVDTMTHCEGIPSQSDPSNSPISLQSEPQCNYDQNFMNLLESIKSGDVQKMLTILHSHPQLANEMDIYGKVPLIYAIEGCFFEAVKVLVHYQADLNLILQDGNTVIHYAARCPNKNILQCILDSSKPDDRFSLICKANLSSGSTALHEAARFKQSENLLILLQFGAEWFSQDSSGESALHIAVRNCDFLSVEILINFVKNSFPAFTSSSSFQYMDVAAFVSQVSFQYKWTPLHFAAGMLHKLHPEQIPALRQIIELLLFHDANPCALDSEGKTPDQLLPASSDSSDTISTIYQLLLSAQQRRFTTITTEEQYFAPCDIPATQT